MAGQPSLKLKTARTLKWNLIDRFASQILYAVTGIVLARELTQEAFGLVGAILVFQAFAALMVDSGFSYALLQRQNPTRADYSTVLWFNIATATVLYVVLYFCAPWIADLFGADMRLVPLSRVMFLSFIINSTAIVQTNRFMKQMNVRPVAIANTVGLVLGGAAGIWLAVAGFEAWAIVWQTIILAATKSIVLWVWSRWLPQLFFSWKILRSFVRVGSAMMFTSFLNTLFLNIYSFFVGNRVGLVALGYYTQSDKWSKMGVSSMSQIVTSTFLPLLSHVQTETERFVRIALKSNRLTAYVTFPIFIGLIVEATPIFHALFGSKWDPSIILFQLLLLRGIFTIFTSLYTNYLLALGYAPAIARLEIWRDTIAFVGLIATLPVIAESTPSNPVWGVMIMLYGQLAAAILAWILTIRYVHKKCGIRAFSLLKDYLPYLAVSLILGGAMYAIGMLFGNDWLKIVAETVFGLVFYLAINKFAHSRIQQDAISYLLGRL